MSNDQEQQEKSRCSCGQSRGSHSFMVSLKNVPLLCHHSSEFNLPLAESQDFSLSSGQARRSVLE